MSINRSAVKAALSPPFPAEIVDSLLVEYQHIKQQFFLRKFGPSELKGGRFAECVVRMLQFLDGGTYTPIGTQFASGATDRAINRTAQNAAIPETMRFYIGHLTRVLLDIRNKRDVAHVGGKASPNHSDSLLVCQCADWILTDLIREYGTCTIDVARQMVANINEIKLPIVAEVNGFVRIQNTKLKLQEKVLVVLYYKRPNKVRDSDIAKWVLYTHTSRFSKEILPPMHSDALIHYSGGQVDLLPLGEAFVEKNISMEMLV